MTIKLFNTMSRKLEEFKPIVSGKVGFYSCGPTVYFNAHIGNLRAYVHTDMLKRMLLVNGFEVKHVMNITDVGHLTDDADDGQDKMEKGSARDGESAWDIAKKYTAAFFADTDAMNIIRPTVTTKATEYIKQQIDMVVELEKLGFTYEIPNDGIYYDTSKFAAYGDLAGGTKAGNKAGARVEFNPEKRNPTDFALWKFSPKNEKRQMEWDSPWGVGFPGWHIECSAMSIAELGPRIDIHTGGIDHIPIHHTNEIAQAEPIVGSPWVNYWLHWEFLIDQTGKMSKSSGEFLTLDVVKGRGYDPMHYRYLLSLGHYSSQIAFSWEAMDAAKNGYERIVRRITELKNTQTLNPEPSTLAAWHDKLLAPMNDNLKSAETLVVFQEILKDANIDDATKLALVDFIDELLGLRFMENAKKISSSDADVPPAVKELADKRLTAKAEKNFALADELRAQAESMGYSIVDTKEGYKIVNN